MDELHKLIVERDFLGDSHHEFESGLANGLLD